LGLSLLSFKAKQLTRSSLRALSMPLGVWGLAVSLLWLSLAASASVEGQPLKRSKGTEPQKESNSPQEGSKESHQPLSFFQPWSYQGSHSGWDLQGLTGPDQEPGDEVQSRIGDLGLVASLFLQETDVNVGNLYSKGKGTVGFGRAP